MECAYFEAGACRSCGALGVPLTVQRAAKLDRARAAVGSAGTRWLPAFGGAAEGYRNKAKMVVGGTAEAPTLGILDQDHRGVDLRHCGILLPGLRAVQPALAAFIRLARLEPYYVAARRGELKHVISTESPDGELMVRFVLRSTEALARIRKHLPSLIASAPRIRVVTANIQPAHAAVLEGEEELVLTEEAALPIRLAGMTLRLPPRSFFQTNTEVAAALYAQAAEWAGRCLSEERRDATKGAPAEPVDRFVSPRSLGERRRIVDLYCGVGGFALALAGPGREVVGIETSADAAAAAQASADAAGLDARFQAGDARAWADAADLVVVNPPRRGLGPELTAALEASGAPTVVYSSCNPSTLERDLIAMPSYRAVEARCFDMFPQTEHLEVMVLLERRGRA